MTCEITPRVVSRDEWLEERKALLAREKALTREQDALAAARRRLPVVRVEKAYCFQGPDGESTLRDLFGDCSQLAVYHFMFDPRWEKGCGGCTQLMDELADGTRRHLHDRNTAFVCISRAPLEKIERYRMERGWTFPWYSSFGSNFNYDFQVTLDESVGPLVYNYRSLAEHRQAGTDYYFSGEPPYEQHGLSLFLRQGADVFHTYSTYGRGVESMGGSHYLLDMSLLGRQEAWEDSPEGWPQRPTYG